MNNEKLIQELDDFMQMNRKLRQEGNDTLCKIRGALTKKQSDDYNRGLEDVWELCRAIYLNPHDGGISCDELHDWYGVDHIMDICKRYTASDALKIYREYIDDKKKSEEAAKKLVAGDVVEYVSNRTVTAIFLYEEDYGDCYWVLLEAGGCPQRLSKCIFTLEKTGKHVDLEGLFAGIKEE